MVHPMVTVMTGRNRGDMETTRTAPRGTLHQGKRMVWKEVERHPLKLGNSKSIARYSCQRPHQKKSFGLLS